MPSPAAGFALDKAADLSFAVSRWERALFDARNVRGVLADKVGEVARATATDAEKYRARVGAPGATPQGTDAAAGFGAEAFARLYGDPAHLDAPQGPGWVEPAHAALSGLPEFDALRSAVAGDPDLSALAAAELLAAIAPKLSELARSTTAPAAGPESAADRAKREAAAAAVRSALRRGIRIAEQRTAEAREGLAGLAPGLESAPPTHEQADPGRFALAETLINDPRMRDVLRRAGRISRLARDNRTTRDEHAREEVVDLERGADLARILPAGLVRLRHPKLRLLALREIVERQALQYRLEGRETLGRGPVIVLVDRSGSMDGEPERWASATAIAILGAAVREHRACTVAEFTCAVDTVSRVDTAGNGARLSPSDPARVLGNVPHVRIATEIASRRSNGGTDFGPVLRYAMAAGVLEDRADFVFVTDGLATADDATLAALTEAKGRGLRVYGLTVAGGRLSPSIAAICTGAVDLDSADDVGAAIAGVMPA